MTSRFWKHPLVIASALAFVLGILGVWKTERLEFLVTNAVAVVLFGYALYDARRSAQKLQQVIEATSKNQEHAVPTAQDLFPDTPRLYGRRADFERLKRYLGSRQPAVIQLIGQSGVGKTALAAVVVRDLGLPYVRQELHGESAEAVASRLFEIFYEQPTPPKSHADIVAWVVSKWQERGCLLVLDNLHCLLKVDATPEGRRGQVAPSASGRSGRPAPDFGLAGNRCAGNEPRAGGQVGAQGHQGRARSEEVASRKSQRHTDDNHA